MSWRRQGNQRTILNPETHGSLNLYLEYVNPHKLAALEQASLKQTIIHSVPYMYHF